MGFKFYNKSSTKEKRRYLRTNQTKPELILWDKLKSKQLGFKFRRQYSIGEYIVDFYCSEKKLVIEIDGDSHFTDEAIKYDKIRTDFFESIGLYVIRFLNNDVMKNIDSVLEKIVEEIERI